MADGISDPFREALSRIAYVPATKVAFQMKSRFWESVDGIYGGISWTSGISRQLWYPSSEFQSETGVLVAAYNNGRAAEIFGRLPVVRRYEVAATYGERFHPGHFLANVKPESAVSVAWGNMTFHDGGWPVHLAESDPDAYTRLVRLTPQGRLYLAGDYLSHWPGWQEGAFATAERAFIAITERALSGD
jgi:monoamine oxidase